jgi:hypothetical protein
VDNLNQNPEQSDLGILSEVEQAMQSVNRKLLSELHLENEAEVLENIRYETSRSTWLDRIPSAGTSITVATNHPQCESVTGRLLFADSLCVVLATETCNYIILSTCITWLSGLQHKTAFKKQLPLDPFGLQILFQDLADQQKVDTWFINGGKTLVGVLVRIFSDSVEVSVDGKLITLKIDQLVAVRSNI